MNLELKRVAYKDTYTIGKLNVDGVYLCDTLEDPPREIKIPNETCIPLGTYKVIINMSNRFDKLMPLLLDVPDFTGVRIHSGNTASDTSGCILVGENKVKGSLINSRVTFDKLMSVISGHDDIKITIT